MGEKEKGVKGCGAFLAHKIGWAPLVRLSMANSRPHPFSFLLGSLIVSLLVGSAYYWIIVASFLKPDPGFVGCRPDSEGSWSIGIYYGKSPLSLSPIELQQNRINANSSAWPVANPVLTCKTLSVVGYPSNFVADPFLYVQDNNLYMFFESKSTLTMKGDIGVARSTDQGATWEFLGIALTENWHLSYPFVFNYQNQIYMMPEGNKKGELRLYRATKFPLEWKLEKVLIKKPLIDASMVQYDGFYWLFASDFTRPGTEKNAELEIWYSRSPLGPWLQHKKNPIYKADKSLGARNAGRLFIYGGSLYRPGQDCGSTYGKRVRLYKVEKLTKDEYKEVPVELGFEMPRKGRNAWNGNRYHHFDAQQLQSGDWIAVMDGDRVPSGDVTWRFLIGCFCFSFAVSMTAFLGFIRGILKSVSTSSYCLVLFRRNESGTFRSYPRFNLKWRKFFNGAYKSRYCLREKMNSNSWLGMLVFCIFSLVGLAFVCMGVQFLYGGNGAEQAYSYKGQYSKFTMVTMTYEARLWNLKLYVKHYSRCESVQEIVVVWNKGAPPDPSEFDSAVPVQIRVEKVNSLNNRFKPDPLIKTRAVFELDDDIMMTCNDVEKGFRVWRENPKKIVGFYPRLIDGDPLLYRNERYARGKNRYNLILTGAAFMDSQFAFNKYWSEEAREGRDFVHKNFNCEDLLMNFLYANSSYSNLDYGRTVEYVHPAWAIDTSKLSSAAISRNTQKHYDIRTKCLAKFKEIYGPLPIEKLEFGTRQDKWDK
ncbi:Glycosyltransferase family protein 64 protein C5 [Rhynchospora pubera]|uniref:Glucosamine inositolphosphorylceramide transferase 1 n=1 Tax=Rhynchospora pubera TaxID=906938 RepID=A0AAV8F1Z3_9POAL|nr:Glycosyltransferase family protein 64 protein C5 [Rhynchospora pubera]